jgi:hypothetical protein
MSQQVMPSAAVKPHWVADMIVGVAGALSAFAVAQAALPIDRPDINSAQQTSLTLRGVQQVSTAPVDLPDFVYGEPVAGYDVVSPFGLRKLPWEKAGRLHAGVDIAAPAGYPVQVAADGVVTRAGFGGGYGRFVEVQHAQGLKTLYAHLGGIEAGIAPGAAVKLGQPIARVGNTGNSTGAHLHFEVHDRWKRPLNPTLFMDREYATARDLPIREAARIPRGVRIAYVSYIPRKKRELMEAEAAAVKAAKDGAQVVMLDGQSGVQAGKAGTGKLAGVQPQVVHLPTYDYNPPATDSWTGASNIAPGTTTESFSSGGDMPGWGGSSGG